MLASSDAFLSALLALDRLKAAEILQQAARDATLLEVIEAQVRPALETIGELWERGDCALSQVYMSGRICEGLIDALSTDPLLTAAKPCAGTADAPRIAIAVLEDYHLLGKQIVRTLLRASGFAVTDLGRQDVAELTAAVADRQPDILLVSTLMLPAALRVRVLADRLQRIAPGTRLVVGGAPYRFDPDLWREVGADAVGHSAGEVPAIIERLTQGAT